MARMENPAINRSTWLLAAILAVISCAGAASAQVSSPCNSIPHLDHPHVILSRGALRVVVFLPDAENGYYRAERFDWSAVIGCASYRGHTYWGQWFRHYDPLVNDSITGPVEEFRPADGAQGYDEVQAGGLFVKIGVGVLRKVADVPYKFGNSYPIVDGGQWKVRAGRDSVVFQQRLVLAGSTSYLYTKRLVLGRKGDSLKLEHTLKNLGARPLVTDVYDHDFYMLDGRPTGPGFVVHFPFAPEPATPLEPDAAVQGNDIVYLRELGPGATVASYLTGYDNRASGYSLSLRNTQLHVGIEQKANVPLSRLYLWSIRTTICPEAYVHLDIPPGRSGRWTIEYRFLAPDR